MLNFLAPITRFSLTHVMCYALNFKPPHHLGLNFNLIVPILDAKHNEACKILMSIDINFMQFKFLTPFDNPCRSSHKTVNSLNSSQCIFGKIILSVHVDMIL